MGFIKDAKVTAMTAEARKYWDAGHSVFTPRFNMPSTQHTLSGNIDTWMMMVQAVEVAGWRLEQWAVTNDTKNRVEAYPVFRRVASS